MKIKILMGFVLVSFLTVSFFQNCSNTRFSASEIVKKKDVPSGKLITIDTVLNPTKSDIKVLFLIDNSYSMTQSRLQLASSLSALMTQLKGFNAEFKIATTTAVSSRGYLAAHPNEPDFELTTLRNSPIGQFSLYTKKERRLNEQRIEIPNNATTNQQPYFLETTYIPQGLGPFKLLAGSTDLELSALVSQISTSILGLEYSLGNENEEGACAAARYLFDETSTRFFKPGDKPLIIVISDENDFSSHSGCIQKHFRKNEFSPSIYVYNYARATINIEAEAYQLVDGVPKWMPTKMYAPTPYNSAIVDGSNCLASDLDPTQAVKYVKLFNPDIQAVRNITRCYYSYQYLQLNVSAFDTNPNLSINFCNSPFSNNASTYTNYYNYINKLYPGSYTLPGSCSKTMIAGQYLLQQAASENTFVIESDPAAFAAKDLNLAFKNKSTQLFGANGFALTTITHLPGESCALQSGQSYGYAYQNLVNFLNLGGYLNANAASICASQYSDTLLQASKFITTEAAKSYLVSLSGQEVIQRVQIKRNGKIINLSNTDYQIIGATITMTGFKILRGDIIEVFVGL